MTAMVRVYRVQNENGAGPYGILITDPDTGETMDDAHWDSEHPCPVEDHLEHALRAYEGPFWAARRDDMVFGTNSLESLQEWFRGWLIILESRGYVVTAWDVPADHVAVGKSGTQVVFVRSAATRVS